MNLFLNWTLSEARNQIARGLFDQWPNRVCER